MGRPFPAAVTPGMTTEISFADWVDWLAFELMFVELFRSATPAAQREMTATIRRLAAGIDEANLASLASRVPNFNRALTRFTAEERNGFDARFSWAVSELSHQLVGLHERANEAAR